MARRLHPPQHKLKGTRLAPAHSFSLHTMAFYAPKCASCRTKLIGPTFAAIAKDVCYTCKVKLSGDEVLKAPLDYKWSECEPNGKFYFVDVLRRLFMNELVLAKIVGQLLVDTYS